MATYHSLVHDRPRLKVFYNSVMTRGVCVIANSQFTADQIARVHGVAAEKIKVVPRGCDAEKLARAAINRLGRGRNFAHAGAWRKMILSLSARPA